MNNATKTAVTTSTARPMLNHTPTLQEHHREKQQSNTQIRRMNTTFETGNTQIKVTTPITVASATVTTVMNNTARPTQKSYCTRASQRKTTKKHKS